MNRWHWSALFVSALLVALVTIEPAADPDLFARVAVGRLIEASGGVVDQDPFAFTERHDRWIDHEWLSGVIFYRASRLGGDPALMVLGLLSLVASVTLIVRAQDEYGRADPAWSALTLLHVFGVWVSVVRSRIFTFLFLGVLMLALVRWREGRRGLLWLLPICFLVWANAHGGFVAGLGLLGAAAVGASVRDVRAAGPLWLCLVACAAVTLINPYGPEYWQYMLGATTMERTGILEWRTMRSWQIGLTAVLLGTFALGAWLRRNEHRVPPEVWAMLGVSLLAAFRSQRLLNFLLVVLAVFGAAEFRAVLGLAGERLSEAYRRASRNVWRIFAAASTVALLATAAAGILSVFRAGLSYDSYPVGAVDWLQTRGAGGRLLTHFNHGSYALWRLYPDYRVAIDGRYEETYPQSTMDLAWLALQPLTPGHEDALAEVAPDYILVPDPGWADHFDERWRRVYADDRSVVLARPGLDAGGSRPLRPVWTPGF